MADIITKNIQLTAGVFILLVLTGGITYFVADGDTAYYCEDLNVVGLCFKLSNINTDGLQTRCYYNESSPRKYKNCKSGWIKYKQTEFIGNEINLTEIGFDLDFDIDKKTILKNIGIIEPMISPCVRMDEFTCRANVYEKGGINKEIKIIIKYCEEYEINYSNGDCLNYSYLEEQVCINWTDENQTICSEYEIIQVQGECLEYEIIETVTNNCIKWKILTQVEIENEMKIKTEELFLRIVDIQNKRNEVKEVLTNKILIEINEGDS